MHDSHPVNQYNVGKIVSITGVNLVECVKHSVTNELMFAERGVANVNVNGDYVRTRQMLNGYPVFVKINGKQLSEFERFCIWKSATQNVWWVTSMTDTEGPKDSRCQIEIPDTTDANANSLENLALNPHVKLCYRSRDKRLVFAKARLSVKSTDDALASILQEADRHAKLKLMLKRNVKCKICDKEKYFQYFRVPACGHAMCELCYAEISRKSKKCPCCQINLQYRDNDQSKPAILCTEFDPLYVVYPVKDNSAKDKVGGAERAGLGTALGTALGTGSAAAFDTALTMNPRYVARSGTPGAWW